MTAARSGWIVERLARTRDLDSVLAVVEASFLNGWTRAMFVRELDRPDMAHLFVLRGPGDAIAGYCSVWLVCDELHINALAIDPARRWQGAAMALLGHALDEGRRLGALEVRRSNRAARQLYESSGFTVREVRPRYYLQPVDDALIMQRRL